MKEPVVKIIGMFLTGSGKTFGIVAIITMILIVCIWFMMTRFTYAPYQPEIFESQSMNRYDLNGDGFVTQADTEIYKTMFNRLDFNGDAEVNIFDQVELAGMVEERHRVFLPVVMK
jgi:hypothetical protein